MKIESQLGMLSMDPLPTEADLQAINIIISGLLEQIMEVQGNLNLDTAELSSLVRMNNGEATSAPAPNPVLIAKFFSNARRIG
ncbi:hypothetical protein [Pseudomonas nitroreducens]|uniref:hypothetical protein n=1 Tax=Pseudomonas nitroreducens TaxID=46680 RepID=UPI00209DD3C7|nr:hypothetical protein [Pseudomonas nitroreducens]MCP1622850.1 hypothetical protein [Pseudomonas nitroreducens]